MFVCAGREEKFAIDDAYCAGYLVSRIVSLISSDTEFTLGDGAQAALGIFGYYRDDKRLLEMSGAGKNVIDIGLSEDLTFLLQRRHLHGFSSKLKKPKKRPKWRAVFSFFPPNLQKMPEILARFFQNGRKDRFNLIILMFF